MGVPVVTLRGGSHASRVGASLLTTLRLPELIAENEEGYLAAAASLAGDPGRLSSLRAGLRPRLFASSLCDAPAYARKVESAFREMWRTFCQT